MMSCDKVAGGIEYSTEEEQSMSQGAEIGQRSIDKEAVESVDYCDNGHAGNENPSSLCLSLEFLDALEKDVDPIFEKYFRQEGMTFDDPETTTDFIHESLAAYVNHPVVLAGKSEAEILIHLKHFGHQLLQAVHEISIESRQEDQVDLVVQTECPDGVGRNNFHVFKSVVHDIRKSYAADVAYVGNSEVNIVEHLRDVGLDHSERDAKDDANQNRKEEKAQTVGQCGTRENCNKDTMDMEFLKSLSYLCSLRKKARSSVENRPGIFETFHGLVLMLEEQLEVQKGADAGTTSVNDLRLQVLTEVISSTTDTWM